MRRASVWGIATIGLIVVAAAVWWRIAAAREQVQWDLSAAAEKGQFERVRELIDQRGARADRWPTRSNYLHGMSAINSAVLGGHTEVAAYLLDRGADIETGESDIRGPLAVTIGRGDLATARMLLERGANANAIGQPLSRMNLSPDLRGLLKAHGAIDETIFREVPPMHLLCRSQMVNDQSVDEFATRTAVEIRRAAASVEAKVTGPLQLIYRGRNPRREYVAASKTQIAPVFELEISLPVFDFTHTAPPGFFYRTAISFKCVAAETGGQRKTIETGWWIVENAVFSAGLGPTYETREVYHEWQGFRSSKNVLEIQCGLYGHTRTSTGGLDYGHDNRSYVREAYR